jgi:UDP-N-acetylglucosamine 2-epimerase (non-hydrolysing)
MPEEVNRVLTDRCSDVLLIPSWDAVENLEREGIEKERIAFVGNVMIDTLLNRLESARALGTPSTMGLEKGGYALATLHRPSNVDTASALQTCLEALAAVAETCPVVLPLHPRTEKQVQAFGLGHLLEPLRITQALPYLEMLALVDSAKGVLTDSGGLQEETTALGVPCLTLREQTERPITVSEGTNRLAEWPLSVSGVVQAFFEQAALGRRGVGERAPDGWDGGAGRRTVEALVARM